MSPEAAAKARGLSRWTVMRAIKSGHLRAYRDNNNHWKITQDSFFAWVNGEGPSSVHPAQVATVELHEKLTAETARADVAEAMLAREREALNDLRADRDAWKQQATALLAAPPKRRGWWPW
ncbi:MAG: helix-turn-helix domain-containing protein [Rhodobacteraceae bacterium]|nr:helix-turn-helix domain-containing protein [Paracoccaceae bacterium]